MQKNKFHFQKNIIFFGVIFLSLSYIALLTIATRYTLSNCYTSLLTNNFDFSNILRPQNSNFYRYFVVLIFLSLLWLKIFLNISGQIIKQLRTYIFVLSLKIQVKNTVKLIVNKDNLAFTFGILKPQIFISQNLFNNLSKKEFDAILNHEKQHMKALDPLKKFIFEIFAGSMPPFWGKKDLKDKFHLLTEAVADAYAKNKTDLFTLANVYLNLFNKTRNLSTRNFSTLNFAYENSRVDCLLNKKTLKIQANLITIFIIFMSFNLLTVITVKGQDNNMCADYNNCIKNSQTEPAVEVVVNETTCMEQLQSSVNANISKI